ncbi:hypothetical protein [Opitutus sp. GAS368]|jgi:hypothetical protein|uniref:hypothetical protein n=1 Tax=Opitutus sp. GAS368 TaxID=1882749 RepID=UPI00087C13DD|nr:hypothetical protein [Opitutus sp. GAS368]SDR87556.1 hypothetical protein SAMN05444173_1188 [Opitutus sp. GAS368]
MSSFLYSFNGLASSLLLNVGLTSLAEKLDPMQRDGGAIKNVLNIRSAAFCDTVCNFQTVAFCDTVCNFRTAAFCDTVCNFRTVAFCDTVCNFTPQGS